MGRLGRRLRLLLQREAVEREMDDEMRFHIEMEIEDRVRAGESPAQARRAAMRDFGGVERFKEEVRDVRGLRAGEDLLRDFRLALRTLRRSPAFTLVAVAILALGVGSTTAIFSVVHGVLLRPLPFPAADRIVHLWEVDEEGTRLQVADANFADFRAEARSFAALAEMAPGSMVSVVGAGEPVRVRATHVSRDFFPVMGVHPARGRGFVAEEQEQGGRPAVIVSDAFWRGRLGADPDLSSARLSFDGGLYSVVGVMPPGFAYPERVDLWIPRELFPTLPSRSAHNWQAVGRLRPGVTLEEAQREISSVAARLKATYGEDTGTVDAALVPLREHIVGDVRPVLLVLLGASAFLLLVATANLGSLLLARVSTRRREIAVRLAMGASRFHLTRQLLVEMLVLALLGGAAGALLAMAGTRALLAAAPGDLPRLAEIRVDPAAWVVAFGTAALVAAALALGSAIGGAPADLRGALAEGQRTQAGAASTRRVRDGLVVAQVALTLVLLVGVGLLGRSLARLLSLDPGYRTEALVVLDLESPWPADDAAGRRLAGFHEELMSRLRAIPGVLEVGGANAFPLGEGRYASGTFLVLPPGAATPRMEDLPEMFKDRALTGEAEYRVASEGWFRALGVPLLRGRLFDERDHADAPHAAVINQSLAETRWPDEDPIGKVIEFGNMDGDVRPFTVVGVVGDVREGNLAEEPRPTLYGSFRQRLGPPSSFSIVMHGSGPATPVIASARGILAELAPETPPRFRTVEEALATSLADRRFAVTLLGAFGGAALLLAVVGIYGVIAYLVAQRTREIGLRLALGAGVPHVLAMVLRRGLVLAGTGIALGVAAALALTRTLGTLLYGVTPTDPVAFAAVVLLLLASALLASWLPARRATRVSPMVAMREP